jgi:hypothetical protein
VEGRSLVEVVPKENLACRLGITSAAEYHGIIGRHHGCSVEQNGLHLHQ